MGTSSMSTPARMFRHLSSCTGSARAFSAHARSLAVAGAARPAQRAATSTAPRAATRAPPAASASSSSPPSHPAESSSSAEERAASEADPSPDNYGIDDFAAAANEQHLPESTSHFAETPFPSSAQILGTTYRPLSSSSAQSPSAEIDWSTSFHGISSKPFPAEAAKVLMRPLQPNEIEIKPDGLLYLPEIIYRRILNQAFGPGGWGLVPRGDMTVANRVVSREWGLVAGGRLVSIARGEQAYFDQSGLATATEGCKSNALMRCCKDLGVASELWDPSFIRTFKAQHCVEGWVEHVSTKKKMKRWRKKHNRWEYPYQEPK